MDLFRWMGVGTSHPSSSNTAHGVKVGGVKPINHADYKQFGLENFGNTCYANSVLQALYFCQPFRELVCDSHDKSNPPIPLALLAPPPPAATTSPPPRPPGLKAFRRRDSAIETGKAADDGVPNGNAIGAPGKPAPAATPGAGSPIPATPPTLFSALRSLFLHIALNPSDKGTVSPTSFVNKLKKENELYRSSMHQDAHEFLNFLLNKIVEDIEAEMKKNVEQSEDLSSSVGSLPTPTITSSSTASPSHSSTHAKNATFVHSLFEGTLTSETRCLTCETVSARDESFLDLSIDIEQNSSVTACLRQFSASEMLSQKNKFFCDCCGGLQEAEKRMKIKKLPNVLALHLKRFKYQEDVQKYIKLAYRVAFPFELRLFNTVDDADDPDRLYQLFAIVVHIGGGPHHGHYIAIVKAHGSWLVFDDDTVETVREADIPKYFGESSGGAGYVLFYQAVDLDLASVGIDPMGEGVGAGDTAGDHTPSASDRDRDPEAAEVSPSVDEAESSGDSEPVAPITSASIPQSVPTSPVPLKLEIPAVAVSEPSASSAAPTVTPSVASVSTVATPSFASTAAAPSTSSGGGFFRTLKHSQSVKIGGDRRRISSQGTAPVDGNVDSSTAKLPAASANGDAVPVPVPASPLVHSKSLKGKDKEGASGWFLSRRKDKKDKRHPAPVPPMPDHTGVTVDDIGVPKPDNAELSTLTHDVRRPSAPGKLEREHSPSHRRQSSVPNAGAEDQDSQFLSYPSMSRSPGPSPKHSPVSPAPPPPTSFPAETFPPAPASKAQSRLPRPATSPSSLSSPVPPLPASADSPPPVPSLPAAPTSPRLRKSSQALPPATVEPPKQAPRPSTAGAKPKRASRKMSLSSMPLGGIRIAGFGRKEKDKDKDKDKDRAEKDKEAAPLAGLVPAMRNARGAFVGRSQSAAAATPFSSGTDPSGATPP